MIDSGIFQRIAKRIEGYEQDMIRLQFALTAIPALAPENGGDGEMEKAKFLVGFLRDLGFPRVESCDAPDGRVPTGVRPNLIARIPGRNPDRTVWVMTHTDIVPPGEIETLGAGPLRRLRPGR